MAGILIVDDSAIVRLLIKQIIGDDPDLVVLGEAKDGEEAVRLNEQLRPDLIIMDINMPVMDGIEATRQITEKRPVPILIFSTEDSASVCYSAILAGAVDVMRKPEFSKFTPSFSNEFINKLKMVAISKKIQNKYLNNKSPVNASVFHAGDKTEGSKYKILLLGASTGGPVAVLTVLQGLGRTFPLPILLTQHIDKAFDGYYVKWLSDTSHVNVALALEGEEPAAGTVYVAPADVHLEVVKATNKAGCILHLSSDEPVHFLRPSVDKMFVSGADVFGSSCIAALLTGMGNDGADGCKKIVENGGFTIIESEETCTVYGMPKAAQDCGGASIALPLQEIAPYIDSKVKDS